MEGFAKGLGALLLVCAVIFSISFIVQDSTPEPVQDDPAPTYTLQLDCSNTAMMHKYGMPTKADCMQWHVHGQWGWIEDGKLYAFDELPGDSRSWDELYGIDSDNPAFDK